MPLALKTKTQKVKNESSITSRNTYGNWIRILDTHADTIRKEGSKSDYFTLHEC